MSDGTHLGAGRSGRSAILVVLLYALIPVAWIAVAVAEDADARSATGSSIPSITFKNYDASSTTATFTARADQLDRHRADRDAASRSSLAAMAAYAIARLDFPGKTLILAGALAVAMFPPISIVGSLFDMWRTIGLYDTWLGLIIPYLTFSLPLAIYTLSAFFREIPWELEQAAQVDGATPFQAFRKIIVPLAAPGVFTAGDPGLHLRLERLHVREHAHVDRRRAHRARRRWRSSRARRSSTQPIGPSRPPRSWSPIPIIIMVLIFQRRIVAGLTAGAVKG